MYSSMWSRKIKAEREKKRTLNDSVIWRFAVGLTVIKSSKRVRISAEFPFCTNVIVVAV